MNLPIFTVWGVAVHKSRGQRGPPFNRRMAGLLGLGAKVLDLAASRFERMEASVGQCGRSVFVRAGYRFSVRFESSDRMFSFTRELQYSENGEKLFSYDGEII